MSRTGQLDVDPETDSSGARFVTRASVQQCWLDRQSKARSRRRAEPAVPLAEVARFTGESPERSWTSSEPASLSRSPAGEPPAHRHRAFAPGWQRVRTGERGSRGYQLPSGHHAAPSDRRAGT